MSLSTDQFIDNLRGSGVISDAEISAFLQNLDIRPTSGKQLSKAMVSVGKLTAFQARRIYQGKFQDLSLSDYLILDSIGAGGMGRVYLAEHRKMGRHVALRTLAPTITQDEQKIRRFHSEVRAAARLSHPNIVAAYDAGEHKGIHYFVMEYVQGTDLSQLVRDKGPLTVKDAVEFTLQAARGLQYAHQHGVVHGDIKPANLLFDGEATIKVLDMGLAGIESDTADQVQDGLTDSGMIMGTFDCMAPEQAVDTKSADARSDIYSLGCTLHYLLTGRPVYEGDTLVKKTIAHRDHPIPSLRKRASDISHRLDHIFKTMLAKQPSQRFQTMEEVTLALESQQYVEPEESTVSTAGSTPQRNEANQFERPPREAEQTPTIVSPADDSEQTDSAVPQFTVATHAEEELEEATNEPTARAAQFLPKSSPGKKPSEEPQQASPLLKYWPIGAGIGVAALLFLSIGIMVLGSGSKPGEPTAIAGRTADQPVPPEPPKPDKTPPDESQSQADQGTDKNQSQAPFINDNENPNKNREQKKSTDQPRPSEPQQVQERNTAAGVGASAKPDPKREPNPESDPKMATASSRPSAPPPAVPDPPAPAAESSRPVEVVRISNDAGRGADATVKRGAGTRNTLGLKPSLAIQTRGGQEIQHVYIRFDLADLTPGENVVDQEYENSDQDQEYQDSGQDQEYQDSGQKEPKERNTGKVELILQSVDGAAARANIRVYGAGNPASELWLEEGPPHVVLSWKNSFSAMGLDSLPLLAEVSDAKLSNNQLTISSPELAEFIRTTPLQTATLVLAGGKENSIVQFFSRNAGSRGPVLAVEVLGP